MVFTQHKAKKATHQSILSRLSIVSASLSRKSSCVNARGIPTAVYEVLHLLSCRGGVPPGRTWLGYPSCLARWGTSSPRWQTDGWTDTCQNIAFPRTTYAVGNYDVSCTCCVWPLIWFLFHPPLPSFLLVEYFPVISIWKVFWGGDYISVKLRSITTAVTPVGKHFSSICIK